MRYRKFIIKGYRGISDTTEINVARESLIPIIGKNESGKTTCLEAINAFDFSNDGDNKGKHLSNIENLYSTTPTPIIVAAEVELSSQFNLIDEFKSTFDGIKKEFLAVHPKGEFDINS
jgi:predicted ATP-dependent endonuclease of OLD family